MRNAILVLFLTLVTFADLGCVAQTNKAIFREIDVSTPDKRRTIALGGDLMQNTDILIKSGDEFVLNGNFGNTKRLALRLTAEGKVREMIFDYRGDKDFTETVESYSKDLGKPTLNQFLVTSVVKVRMAGWEDGRTRFEIVETSYNNQTSVSSALIDISRLVHMTKTISQ